MAVVVLLALRKELSRRGAIGIEGYVLVKQRLHVRRCLSRRLVAERAGLELGENYTILLLESWQICGRRATRNICIHTLESVDGPLFKLLKRDVCCWRGRVEVESVGILHFFVGWVCKLLLAVVGDGSPFAVVSVEVLTDHIDGCVISWAAKGSIALLHSTEAENVH